MNDIIEFVARWTFVGALAFFFIWTLGYLSGVASNRWRTAALVMLGFLTCTTLTAALLT
jgi:hypothetical protein